MAEDTLGDYQLVEHLGGGGFGQVYRAIHARSGAQVAIKRFDLAVTDRHAQRAIVEARAAASIDHPNVVKVLDLQLDAGGRPYLVMELLEGETLRVRWARGAAAAEVVATGEAILRGLAAAHARGVVHRDLKPDNVFVTRDGRVVIVDFGLAKLIGDPMRLTSTGQVIGTPMYMAPEQIRGKPIDPRTDLYALGAMLHEALGGKPVFDAGTTFQMFEAHCSRPVPPLPPSVPARLARVLERALAKEPAARWPDATAMRRALSAASQRRPRWPFAVAAVCIAGATATIAFTLASPAASHALPDPPPPERAAPLGLVPPPLPGEPALDPRMEDQLHAIRDALARGTYPADASRTIICRLRDTLRTIPDVQQLEVRRAAEFTRRLLALYEAYAPNTTCPAAGSAR